MKLAGTVVPRTGYVDRNIHPSYILSAHAASYPARGTWIEMMSQSLPSSDITVVPRTGYVDRNFDARILPSLERRRTPHGVRG